MAAPVFPLFTDRLRLRPLVEDDLDELYRVWSDPRVSRWTGEHSRAEVAEELRFHIEHQSRHGWAIWAVEDLSSSRFLGDCGLQPLELRGPEVEHGYDLHPDAWGCGLATEAARATVELAFDLLGLDRLVAVVKPDHIASRRVLEKSGLELAGEREAYGESLLLYEITARGWRARRPR
jgi:ribosomal-protein-alanine N-acetyltransferase